MTDDEHPADLIGAYVIGACPPEEERSVLEHANRCPSCAAEIAEFSRVADWMSITAARMPVPGLRSRVMSAALAARPAAGSTDTVALHRLVEPYQAQVRELDELLSGLSEPQWSLASGKHRSVRDLVVHLRGNDELVAGVAGVRASTVDGDPRRCWRRQADAIIDVVASDGPALLDRQVRLAGRAAIRRPLREALIQRGFETWIHAEDVRGTLRLPSHRPSPQQLTDIVDFAVRLLPGALDAVGRAHPDKAVRLVLTGAGGGTRVVGLSATTATPGTVVAEVSLPAERFCRLLAGRLAGSSATAEVDGDRNAANDFLSVAATMGCD